jgi:3-hydroxy-9,10-secoandrosta-1,3,5(10)-triene-9,17-dione monooxygenase reductase component
VIKGLVAEAPVVAEAHCDEYHLTEKGRAVALKLIAAAKGVESQLVERLGDGEAPVLKSLLNRLLAIVDPQSNALWGDKNKPPPAGRR